MGCVLRLVACSQAVFRNESQPCQETECEHSQPSDGASWCARTLLSVNFFKRMKHKEALPILNKEPVQSINKIRLPEDIIVFLLFVESQVLCGIKSFHFTHSASSIPTAPNYNATALHQEFEFQKHRRDSLLCIEPHLSIGNSPPLWKDSHLLIAAADLVMKSLKCFWFCQGKKKLSKSLRVCSLGLSVSIVRPRHSRGNNVKGHYCLLSAACDSTKLLQIFTVSQIFFKNKFSV